MEKIRRKGSREDKKQSGRMVINEGELERRERRSRAGERSSVKDSRNRNGNGSRSKEENRNDVRRDQQKEGVQWKNAGWRSLKKESWRDRRSVKRAGRSTSVKGSKRT